MKPWRPILAFMLVLVALSTGPVAKALSQPPAEPAAVAPSEAPADAAATGTGIAAGDATGPSARSKTRCETAGTTGFPCGFDCGLWPERDHARPVGRTLVPASSRTASGFSPTQTTGPPRAC